VWAIRRAKLRGLRFANTWARQRFLGEARATERLAINSCPRRVAKTSAPQSTPFARQVAASRAPHLRMRFLCTGYLSARHDFWPRPLSVGTHPTVTTCEANTGKMTRFLRFHRTLRQVRRWSVGHDRPPGGSWQVPARRFDSGGSGRSLTAATERPSRPPVQVPGGRGAYLSYGCPSGGRCTNTSASRRSVKMVGRPIASRS
jgi:hypothetical protein